MILSSHGIIGSSIVQIDADAQAFFDRVTTAGGSLSLTEKSAVNQLVLDMKADGIWTKMKAIYPMVGGGNGTTAQRTAACAQNLKSSSFTGTFTATGWTFASTGVTPNGSSAYMDTGLVPNTNLSVNSQSLTFYSRSNISGTLSAELGAVNSTGTSRTQMIVKYGNTTNYNSINHLPAALSVSYNTDGFFIVSRTTSISTKSYRNSTTIRTDSTTSAANVDRSIFISARNDGSANIFDNKECAFSSIGDGLNDTEASDFYDAVQAFQTTLGRQV